MTLETLTKLAAGSKLNMGGKTVTVTVDYTPAMHTGFTQLPADHLINLVDDASGQRLSFNASDPRATMFASRLEVL